MPLKGLIKPLRDLQSPPWQGRLLKVFLCKVNGEAGKKVCTVDLAGVGDAFARAVRQGGLMVSKPPEVDQASE